MTGRPQITDRAVSNVVTANCDTGALDLVFLFVDEIDPAYKAQIELEIAPDEAVDFMDRMIGELGKLGVHLDVGDDGKLRAHRQGRSGRSESAR